MLETSRIDAEADHNMRRLGEQDAYSILAKQIDHPEARAQDMPPSLREKRRGQIAKKLHWMSAFKKKYLPGFRVAGSKIWRRVRTVKKDSYQGSNGGEKMCKIAA